MFTNEDILKNMMELFSNPLFRNGFFEFAQKAQKEGLEAAQKFWGLSAYGKAFPNTQDIVERMTDWYKAMGFVPREKYDELMTENEKLKAENQLLKSTIRDLQVNLFTEGGERAQELWHDIIDKQMKMNSEAASAFLEAIRQFKAGN